MRVYAWPLQRSSGTSTARLGRTGDCVAVSDDHSPWPGVPLFHRRVLRESRGRTATASRTSAEPLNCRRAVARWRKPTPTSSRSARRADVSGSAAKRRGRHERLCRIPLVRLRSGEGEVTLRRVNRKLAFAVSTAACVVSLAACGSSGGTPDLTRFKDSRRPYYYVGRTFDGLRLTHAEQYIRGVALFAYGTCNPPPDGGCPAPLELQHRLCRGRVTVVIFIGVDPKPGRAARAARALRPLSKGAKGVKPDVAFDRSPPC